MEPRSTKGWSWGEFALQGQSLALRIDNKLGFELPYEAVANCSLPAKTELALELHQADATDQDLLCEMRLYIPDADACENLNKELLSRAGLGAYAGDALVSLYDLPMVTPRGKYQLDMFPTFMKLHGKTYDYKILYKDVSKAFLLPKPDGVHVAFAFGLETPIRQGNTHYPFVVLQFLKEQEDSIKLNLPPDQIRAQFGEDLSETLEGRLFDIVSRLFKAFIKVNVVIPGQFKSATEAHAVKCSIKASEGLLYPLQKSFFFIHKPVIYVRYEDVRECEFARVSESSLAANRYFDLRIHSRHGDFQFTGLERQEYKPLMLFLEKKKIPITNIKEDDEADQQVLAQVGADEDEEESDDDDQDFEVEDSDA